MRIVILFAKAGGGHESCAKALKSQILKQNPEVNIELIDILSKSPKWQQDLFCASYVFFTDKIPLFWSFLQILWKIDFLAKLTAVPLRFQIQNYLKEILKSNPDQIICTYFLIDKWLQDLQNDLQSDLKRELQHKTQNPTQNCDKKPKNNENNQKNTLSKIPIWTIVTDIFSPHSVWFVGKNCNYLVFSKRAKLAAIGRGVCTNKIKEFGVFFGERFEKVGTKSEIQTWKNNLLTTKNTENNSSKTEILKINSQNLQIKQIPTLLVVGGGESMPGGTKILENLLGLEINFNLVFVCGRNEILRQKCDKIVQNWQQKNQNRFPISQINIDTNDTNDTNIQNYQNQIPRLIEKTDPPILDNQNHLKTNSKQYFSKNIQILGFTSNLYEFINVSDLVICKAGPATILEVISQKKPFLISHFIWEQEIGNCDFAVSNNVAIYQKNPKKLAQIVQKLLSNPVELAKLTQNYQNFHIQNDLANIANFLIKN